MGLIRRRRGFLRRVACVVLLELVEHLLVLSSLRGVLVLVMQLLTEALVVRCGASDQRRDAAQVAGGRLGRSRGVLPEAGAGLAFCLDAACCLEAYCGDCPLGCLII